VLVYDGDCGLCSSTATALAGKWTTPARAVSSQCLGAKGLARLGLTLEDVRRRAWWIDEHGRRFGGPAAIAQALKAAGGWRSHLGSVILVPPFSWVSALAYRGVARWRHRLPGGTNACRVDL
jgi:predicted DCC family thiol-disulfide oxidoreductase YuxK